MKILVLNPHIDAEHNLVKVLQQGGASVLICGDIEQAWQVLQLHGSSIDLALLHREGGIGKAQDYGLTLLFKVKGDPTQSDLPMVVTSEAWSESEFVNHQQTPMGANAYLRWPCAEQDFISTLEAVLGVALNGASRTAATIPVSSPMLTETTQPTHTGVVASILEATPNVVYGSGNVRDSSGSIILEAPEITFGGVLPAEVAQSALPTEPVVAAEAAQPPVFQPTVAQPPQFNPPPPPAESSGISVIGSSGETPQDPASVEMPVAEPLPQEELSEEDQRELAQELPYLFNRGERPASESGGAQIGFYHPVGDAVVPGGAAHTPDVETLKKYLLLREQDVSALSAQLKSAHEQISAVEAKLREEQARSGELMATANEQKRRIDNFEREKAVVVESMQSECNELRFQVKARTDKAKLLEAQVREATEEMERLKERVRSDIRKIRVREKELENRLEILRKDSEVLIGARENKIIELKRKLDLLEFNMDLLQNQHSKERETAEELRKRLAKAAQVVRVAGGLLGTSAGEVLEELSNELSAESRKGKAEREAS